MCAGSMQHEVSELQLKGVSAGCLLMIPSGLDWRSCSPQVPSTTPTSTGPLMSHTMSISPREMLHKGVALRPRVQCRHVRDMVEDQAQCALACFV